MSETPAPWRPRAVHRLLRAVGFGFAFSLPTGLLAWAVRANVTPVVRLDEAAIRAATDLTRADPALRRALLIWETAFQARWVNLVAALVCLWVWRRRGLPTRALWAVATLVVAWNLQLDVKYLVRRARPVVEDAVAHAPGYSFPSGHAMNTTAAGLTVVVLLWPLLGPRGRAVAVATAVTAVVVTGVDRVLLGAHFPSDVLAGILLGAALVSGSYLGYIGWHQDPPRQKDV